MPNTKDVCDFCLDGLKDENKRLKEKLQRCNCNIKIPSILEVVNRPIIMDIKGELPHLTKNYRNNQIKE
ncbi:hypothetical protein [Helicobacter pylori]|uniref:hypothetical protein n=1 Tax=Helicobacter pylori TaxID=210 RepID=UPI0030C84A37